jgi:hypothetical protein
MLKNLKSTIAILWFISSFSVSTSSSANSFIECLSNGYETGSLTAEQFCNTLENAYLNSVTIQYSMEPSGRLCHGATILACRAALRIGVNSRPLCRQLISSNWDGSSDRMNEFKSIVCS